MDLSFIIPCYNEEGNVEVIYNEIRSIFKKINYEIIFINDGSKDKTIDKLKDICKNSKENIKVINFSRNFGKEAAMYAGLKESKGDFVTIIDADMQQDPNLVLEMLNFLNDNQDYDAVAMFQEVRREGKILSFFKNCFYKVINKISDIDFIQGASDFRTFRRKMVESILELGEYYRFSKGIFSWVGFNTYYMPYKVKERNTGKSSWSFWKLFKYAIEGIISFSTAPLRISTFMGLMSSIGSLVYLIFVVIQKIFFGIAVPGYATLVVLILFIGGIQLFSLGLLGEYIARIYIETKKRPIYIAKEIIYSNNSD